MKKCSYCDMEKPLTEFYARNKNNPEVLASRCKPCALSVSAAWRTDNLERSAQVNKEWRAANKDVIKARNRIKAYGTDGLRLLAEQNNLCAACDIDLTTLPYKERHLDHNHETGFVRGWLCSNCNLGIGKFKDNPKALRQAADYLERKTNGKGRLYAVEPRGAGETSPRTGGRERTAEGGQQGPAVRVA